MSRGCEPWEDDKHTHHVHNTCTHYYAVLVRRSVKLGRVELVRVAGTTSFGMVENVELVVLRVVSSKDIGDEAQD